MGTKKKRTWKKWQFQGLRPRSRRRQKKMSFKQSVVMVLSVMFALSLFAGKMEDYGGFKARDYKEGADGKLYTSAGTEVKNFVTDLDAKQQREYIEAAQMASSGYPDHRHDEFKNTSYKEIAKDGEKSLKAIVDLANGKSSDSGFQVYDQPIREYDDASGKWIYSGEKIYTITGKDETRLCVRVFEKVDENGKKTIGVVYGGTDWGTTGVTGKLWVDDAADARDDAKQITHFAPTPQAYKDAATVLKAIVELYPNTDINVYGHSEGGGEAMYSVLATGVKNGEDGTIKYYGVNSAGLNGLKTNDVINESLTKEDVAKNFTLIQNCQTPTTLSVTLGKEEWCSTRAYQFGTVISIPDMGDKFGVDKDGKISGDTFLGNGKNEEEGIRGKDVTQIKKSKFSVDGTSETVDVKSNLDNQHGVEETLWKMTHCTLKVDKAESTSKADEKSDEVTNGKEKEPDPFDSNPFESRPANDGNGQVCPIPGNNNTTPVRTTPTSRYRGGRGGGDTKAVIWPR